GCKLSYRPYVVRIGEGYIEEADVVEFLQVPIRPAVAGTQKHSVLAAGAESLRIEYGYLEQCRIQPGRTLLFAPGSTMIFSAKNNPSVANHPPARCIW